VLSPINKIIIFIVSHVIIRYIVTTNVVTYYYGIMSQKQFTVTIVGYITKRIYGTDYNYVELCISRT